MAVVGAATLVATTLVTGNATGAAPAAQTGRDPVVIVAGTFVSQPIGDVFYAPLKARLVADGYDAHIYGLPGSGLGDIADASADLAGYVDDLLASTGSDQVDLIGHSQGGLVARYYARNLGGDVTVDSLISLAAPNHGTAVANLLTLLGLGNCLGVTACEQMAAGSGFLAALNAGDESPGAVDYTNIATRYDEIVLPYRTAFLAEDGNVTNITVQDRCWLRIIGHIGIALDGAVYSGIEQALEHRDRIRLNCWAV
jgi:triacylglycerol esterase/lipase EstA (alpha/beta hydrolase family)